jgi:hypothetical protein
MPVGIGAANAKKNDQEKKKKEIGRIKNAIFFFIF